jgi:hypothetical protein
MINKTIAIYVFVDDILKNFNHKEPINRKAYDSEIITTALVSSLYFKGHIEHTINFVKVTGLMPKMLGKSRFNRRIHAIFELIIDLFFHIAEAIKRLNISSEYAIDSFPVPVCENIRIGRSKIIKGEQYRGYKASKRQYFYGFTVQVIATIDGIPVEFALLPGSIHDSEGIKNMFLNLPKGSILYGDSGYTDYQFEDDICNIEEIKLMIARKSNSKRKRQPWEEYLINTSRKGIETVFSQVTYMFPKRIHAVTVEGMLLKIVLFIFVYTFQKTIL